MLPRPTSAITTFDDATTHAITVMLREQHTRLAQLDRPYAERSLTASNYDSALKALGEYLTRQHVVLPTKSLLADWRDAMLAGRADESGRVYAVRTINMRLSV